MKHNKFFLIPDLRKAILFVAFLLLTVTGMIQHSPITETPPAMEPSPLGDFSFTYLAIMLAFIIQIPLIGLAFSGVVPYTIYPWLFYTVTIGYLCLLSCYSVSGFDRYRRRFSGLGHVILGLSVIFGAWYQSLFSHPPILSDDLMNLLGAFLIGLIYLHLLVCLGFYIHDGITRHKGSTN